MLSAQRGASALLSQGGFSMLVSPPQQSCQGSYGYTQQVVVRGLDGCDSGHLEIR